MHLAVSASYTAFSNAVSKALKRQVGLESEVYVDKGLGRDNWSICHTGTQ